MEDILEKINRAVLKFLEPLTPEETYAIIVEEAVKLIGALYASVILEQNGELKRVYSTLPTAKQTRLRPGGFTYRSFKERKALAIYEPVIKENHPEIANLGIKSNIFIPLQYRRKPVGVLIVNSSKDEKFTQKELDTLKLFGSLVTLAIRKMQLYSETKKALESRDMFISMAAHELRTPITTIHGYAQLLYQKHGREGGADGRWIRELHTESIRLTLLVNDLLEINRIKTGKLQYNFMECSLRELIQRAITNFKFNRPERTVEFQDSLGKKVDLIIGDFDKLLQVIINLMDNAAKFSKEDTSISLSLKDKVNYFLIQVKDQGKGIDKKDLSKVFEGYYQAGNHSTEGMGLGLFLVKNIIEQHHGSVHIHSRLNKGTLVEVQLPKVKI